MFSAHFQSIPHKAFCPGLVQIPCAGTNISYFIYVTFVCKVEDVKKVIKPTTRSYQMDWVDNLLNKPENISTAVNRRLAQIDAEGEQIAVHTHKHTHSSGRRVTDDSDSSKLTAGLCCAGESPFQKHRPSRKSME